MAIPSARDHPSVRPLEAQLAALVPPHLEPALVHEHVVVMTEQGQILEARLAPLCPMAQVMSVHAAAMAGGEGTPAIA